MQIKLTFAPSMMNAANLSYLIMTKEADEKYCMKMMRF